MSEFSAQQTSQIQRAAVYLLAWIFLGVTALRGAEPLTLQAAARQPRVLVEITGGVPLAVTIRNESPDPVRIAQPAGLICRSTSGDARIVTLRALEMVAEAHTAVDATVPAAPLRGGEVAGPLVATDEREPRLAPLLAYLAQHNDVPRPTAALLVRCILENISFAGCHAAGTEPAPEQVIAGVDALGVLRQIAPAANFALAADPELKLRALRNPVTRGKAMRLYGIDLPEAPLPPELGTLLHTKPGDNCPICRQRALMQPREDGL